MKSIGVVLLSLLCLAIRPSHAQVWPNKPVRIIAPFAPGGAADTLGRIVADPLSSIFKQQFFVENRAGAGGMIGAAAVATAAPDGYTFVVSGIASHVIAPAMSPNPGFDPVHDFNPHRLSRRSTGPVDRTSLSSSEGLQGIPCLREGQHETARLYLARHRNAGQPLRRGPRAARKI
jgi:tripartite-type tricarboxylate transporter receptor subunit TctC